MGNRALKIAGALPLIVAAGAANAALPTEATAAFTQVATDFGLVLAAAFVGMAAVTGGWILFDMVRKGLRKSGK